MARCLLLTLLVLALRFPDALAHDGPPYAVLVDHATGPFLLSVWADPDVGTGTFWVYLEAPAGEALPQDDSVTLFFQPADRRIPEARYEAAPTRNTRGKQQRFVGLVHFDTQERWRARVAVHGSRGDGEAEVEVDVTPPGQGPILDFILYLFPFVAVGLLFLMAMVRRRRAPRAASG